MKAGPITIDQNKQLHWFIKLGLWDQAIVYSGEYDLKIDMKTFPDIKVKFAAGKNYYEYPPIHVFYVQV